ncbi:MAG TPA: hypothetical protein PKA55_01655 [Rhodoblastus sp.]|nr:hypothetical protein [Rhodoblastus sp.]
METLILQSLVRTLVAKRVLSADDVRGLLFDAATRLDVVGSEQTPQAARDMVNEDLVPFFLDEKSRAGGS